MILDSKVGLRSRGLSRWIVLLVAPVRRHPGSHGPLQQRLGQLLSSPLSRRCIQARAHARSTTRRLSSDRLPLGCPPCQNIAYTICFYTPTRTASSYRTAGAKTVHNPVLCEVVHRLFAASHPCVSSVPPVMLRALCDHGLCQIQPHRAVAKCPFPKSSSALLTRCNPQCDFSVAYVPSCSA